MVGDRVSIPSQCWLVLRGLASEEAVKIFEAIAGGPIVKWSLRCDLFFGCVVPLPPSAGIVSIVLKNLCNGSRRLGNNTTETIKIVCDRSDLTIANSRVIAPGKQCGSRRRAHCGRMKAIEGYPHLRYAIKRRRIDLTAVGRWRAWSQVIHQNDKNIRRAFC